MKQYVDFDVKGLHGTNAVLLKPESIIGIVDEGSLLRLFTLGGQVCVRNTPENLAKALEGINWKDQVDEIRSDV